MREQGGKGCVNTQLVNGAGWLNLASQSHGVVTLHHIHGDVGLKGLDLLPVPSDQKHTQEACTTPGGWNKRPLFRGSFQEGWNLKTSSDGPASYTAILSTQLKKMCVIF